MTPLTASDILRCDVVCVAADQHPQRVAADVAYYAVFSVPADTGEAPRFLGLVGKALAARFSSRIFADLLPSEPQASVDAGASLESVRAHLDRSHGDALVVYDAEGGFLGVVCRRSLFEGLLDEEESLLEHVQRQRLLAEEERDRLEQWSVKLQHLHEASKTLLNITSHTSLDSDILQGAIETLCELLGARYGAVGLLGPDGKLQRFIPYGMSEDEIARIDHWPQGKGLLGVTLGEDQSLCLEDLATDPRRSGFPPGHLPMKSLLAVPLGPVERILGHIYLSEKEDGGAFTAEDEFLATSFAQALSLVLINAREMEEIKAVQDRVAYLCSYDPLTGLANRMLFNDRAHQALIAAHRNQGQAAVIVLDIDNFKLINESLGHAHGDRLLKQVAARLLGVLREEDTVAHLSGDEFLILLPEFVIDGGIHYVMQKVMSAFAAPFALPDRECFLSASMGVALYPTDGKAVETLLRNADAALFSAKRRGRNQFQLYKTEMNEQLIERMSLESRLRDALARNELSLHYQPVYSLKTRQVVGLEALLRWNSAELGPIPPNRFIPVAEDSGQIIALGEWVLAEAARQARAWQVRGLPALPVAVNLSAKQFNQESLTASIARALEGSGLGAHYLELELTESLTMENPARTVTLLGEIRDMGVRLLIDDFGTGYSNLSYLKRFPVDKLKLDKSFVHDLGRSDNDLAIARAVISLGHSLGLAVLAEGVETREQLGQLLELGCDEIQGYYYCRPMDAAQATRWLAEPPPLVL
ncbi:MAG: EAL domain-containing protein [Gammaproteobacteria bacterium]|nr:EAL domain-containing protein [Gammaproteobacteria bacterium]